MKEKLYKRRGWARKAAAKLRFHTVVEMPFKNGFMIRPMTQDEKDRALRGIDIQETMRTVYGDALREMQNQSSAIFGRLRRA